MAKSKSSASSATRKKHAKKQAGKGADGSIDEGDTQPSGPTIVGQAPKRPAQRGQKKDKKKHAKVKVYVPPPKPPKGLVDPVDLYGLGVAGDARVDPNLIVVLRKLHKRDEKTLARAIEELDGWLRAAVDAVQSEEELQDLQATLHLILPIWVHHFARLVGHSARRIRMLAATLQSFLSTVAGSSVYTRQVQQTSRQILISDISVQQEGYLASWLCSAFDLDRIVRSVASLNWQNVTQASDEHIDLAEHAIDIASALQDIVFADTGSEQGHDAEVALDRAQLISAMGALHYLLEQQPQLLSMDTIEPVLRSGALWKELEPSPRSSGPLRSATWRMLALLLTSEAGTTHIEACLHLVSKHALAAAWNERDHGTHAVMWLGLLPLLRKFPQSWTSADKAETSEDTDEDEEDSDSDAREHINGDTNDISSISSSNGSHVFPPSIQGLFNFLQSGCGSNIQNYPVLLLIFSTLPPSLLPMNEATLSTIPTSFWAAFDSRAVDIKAAAHTNIYLTAWLDLVAFMQRRLAKTPDASSGNRLLRDQLIEMWTRYLANAANRTSLFAPDVSLRILRDTINQQAPDDQDDIYRSLQTATPQLCVITSEDPRHARLVALSTALETLPQPQTDVWAADVFLQSIESLKEHKATSAMDMGHVQRVKQLLTFIYRHLSHRPEQARNSSDLSDFIRDHLSAYFIGDNDVQAVKIASIWLPLEPEDANVAWSNWHEQTSAWPVPPQMRLIELFNEHLPRSTLARLPCLSLEPVMLQHMEDVLQAEQAPPLTTLQTLARITQDPRPFAAQFVADTMRSMLAQRVVKEAGRVVQEGEHLLHQSKTIWLLLAEHLFLQSSWSKLSDEEQAAMVNVSALACVMLGNPDLIGTQTHLTLVYDRLRAFLTADEAKVLSVHVLDLLRHQIAESNNLSPAQFLGALAYLPDGVAPPASILPGADELEQRYTDMQQDRSGQSMSALSSVYARIVILAMQAITSDASLATSHPAIATHVAVLTEMAQDEHDLSVLGEASTESDIVALQAGSEQIVNRLIVTLGAKADGVWHRKTTELLLAHEKPNATHDSLQYMMVHFASRTTAHGSARSDVPQRLIAGVFRNSSAGQPEADVWLNCARRMSTRGEVFARSIIAGTRDVLLENPRFNRYQNELASDIASIPPERAGDKAFAPLMTLIASAPPHDSSAPFLPAQRTIFLLQAIQRWAVLWEAPGSDIGDSRKSLLFASTELFQHLVPIVQDVAGAHWEFASSLLDTICKTFQWTKLLDAAGLQQALRLYEIIDEYASTNRALREQVHASQLRSRASLLAIFVMAPALSSSRATSSLIESLAMIIVQWDTSVKTEAFDPAQAISHFASSNQVVRHAAYKSARAMIMQIVEDLVVELEISDDAMVSGMNEGFLTAVAKPLIEGTRPEVALGYLLTWLAILDHFAKASLRLKSRYIEQLRDADVVGKSLIPTVLMLASGRGKLPPSTWKIDEVDVETLDGDSLAALAGHVYYRALGAVPSLVRVWWESCRDRQTSMALASFTAKTFSPLLIEQELAKLLQPEFASQLNDDDMKVKVNKTVSEVKAVYTVDEQTMEIGIRIPPEFPLQGVEVKDLKKVGVSEQQWRAWIMGMQQVISNQDGAIYDALHMFKRNVALHFEGKEPCAICYSIISVTDRTLPTKSCKTCKNTFHAACLYKWFQSSTGSSCPLCRSLF
ncbi:uncharacterized protein L969DRAFT_46272 [Mixia osmundae IAM 14324]|uniref:E3 ubiquitin-protein ligase listerin n=1 Tax=Mixia osmundae (strain CBS 9802 / IAM 14324 / JCM 22182 / KY 12970) TaxID=764103 RepID=G7E5U0_MIXOS|nr:uncharacterized protein L969DRAFT_46272 [Mixia osmundae IAM 14324]KEI40648.1 hypothetical protein L969DRAFT_46272 [Mixia osmundae IAM 14324]GAA98200.1 hypothetical protein E5Q_04883 [Mixia osmundae IAM 14324]